MNATAPQAIAATLSAVIARKVTGGFSKPVWDHMAGRAGAYVSESACGQYMAFAEPLGDHVQFWLVRFEDGETLHTCTI